MDTSLSASVHLAVAVYCLVLVWAFIAAALMRLQTNPLGTWPTPAATISSAPNSSL